VGKRRNGGGETVVETVEGEVSFTNKQKMEIIIEEIKRLEDNIIVLKQDLSRYTKNINNLEYNTILNKSEKIQEKEKINIDINKRKKLIKEAEKDIEKLINEYKTYNVENVEDNDSLAGDSDDGTNGEVFVEYDDYGRKKISIKPSKNSLVKERHGYEYEHPVERSGYVEEAAESVRK
jgi:DNA polymerase III delta prime subunit